MLGKGLNFVPTPKSVNNVDFITEIERLVSGSKMTTDEANKIRFEVTKALQSFKQGNDNLTIEERRALRNLRERKDLMILPTDKGKSVCIMTSEQYKSKVNELISDDQTYERLQKDPTNLYTHKVREALKSIEEKGNLSRGQYLRLYPSDPSPPLFYGLPKVHKQGVPLRPIVSTIGSATYEVSKHLAGILAPLVGNTEFTVKDSKDFVEFTRTLELAEDDVMVSFDVQSLFTSVPTDVACDVAKRRLEVEFEREDSVVRAKTGMDVEDILVLLRLCLGLTYFQVDGSYYKQNKGTAMGSPVSVVVANLFMEELEEKSLQSFTYGVKVWKRYVDDTFVVIEKGCVDALHEHLNAQAPGVSFTVEGEKDGAIAFLDVEVRRTNGKSVDTAVFRKATHTDKYLDFGSHHSRHHKESVVRSLVRRGKLFPSDETEKVKEAKHIDTALRANNYPNRFIKKTRHKILVREIEKQNDLESKQEKQSKPLVVLPYVQGVTEKITRVLRPYARVSTKPGRNLKNMLVSPKDKREKCQNSGLVYQYECECGKVYVGETCRTIRTREKEHKRAIRNLDENHSGISKHVIESGHSIAWAEVKILAFETDWKRRKIKEGIFIAKTRSDMLLNTKPGVPMDNVYRVLR